MKIYHTQIKDCIMQIIKDESAAILFDPTRFAEALNNYSVNYMDECYLINQAMKEKLGEKLLLDRRLKMEDAVSQMTDQGYDYEDAVFMVSMIKEVVSSCQWDIQVANFDEALQVAVDSQIPLYIQAMALAYFEGIGVSQDYEKAYELFQKAYDSGGQECFYYLGKMNAEGLGTEVNLKKARSYYLEGIANSTDTSRCYYGLALLKKSLDEDYLADLLKSNEPDAHLMAGDYFLKKNQPDEAAAHYLKGAVLLDDRCCVRYGKMALRKGNAQGLPYLVYSYYQFNVEAMEYLGYLFIQGTFVERDAKRGVALLNEAADEGNKEAKELLDQYEAV